MGTNPYSGRPAVFDPLHVTDSRNRRIDSLRGLAALAVLGFHVWLYARPVPGTERVTALDYVWAQGRLGYVLFFALSGFLLYLPWLRAARGQGGQAPAGGLSSPTKAARSPCPATTWHCSARSPCSGTWPPLPASACPLPSPLPSSSCSGRTSPAPPVMKLNPPMWTLAVEVSFYLALPADRAGRDPAGRRPAAPAAACPLA